MGWLLVIWSIIDLGILLLLGLLQPIRPKSADPEHSEAIDATDRDLEFGMQLCCMKFDGAN